MKKKNQIVNTGEAMHVDAFRFGVPNKEDADFFILDLGKAITDESADSREIKSLTSIAISPADLRILLYQIIHIGLNYENDFWKGIISFEDEVKDGDESGEN